jgi:hypothetical protein
MNHGEIASFIWGVADPIRDTFKHGKYQDVILPLTVLRSLDCVLLGPALARRQCVLVRSAGFTRNSCLSYYNNSKICRAD